MEQSNPNAVGIGAVIAAELEDIAYRRATSAPDPPPKFDAKNWKEECHKQDLFGVSISGGGIRSATFALGVLQGLTEKQLLQKADYVSTVSGGGYIGSWLQGVLNRTPKNYAELMKPVPEPAIKDPVTFLRKYSNYLAPRVGLSLDALVIPLIWFRNMALNQVIIIAAFAALFLVTPWLGVGLGAVARAQGDDLAWSLLAVAAVLAAIAVVAIGRNLRHNVEREFENSGEPVSETEKGTGSALLSIAVPMFLAVILLVCAVANGKLPMGGRIDADDEGLLSGDRILGLLIFLVLYALLQWRGGFVRWYAQRRKENGDKVHGRAAYFHVLWMSTFCAAFTMVLLHLVTELVVDWGPGNIQGSFMTIAWAPPLYLLAIVMGVGLQIGFMGQDFPDSGREWLVRLAAQLLTIAGAWAALFAIAIFAPLGVAKLWRLCLETTSSTIKSAGVAGALSWVASTIASIYAAKSSKSGKDPKGGGPIDLLARYGPLVAISGFLIGVAFGVQALFFKLVFPLVRVYTYTDFVSNYWTTLAAIKDHFCWPLSLLAAAVALFLLFSVRVNINEFSMHHFYRNRLVRCYLGASAVLRPQGRKPDLFTGFDPQDDLAMPTLARTKFEPEKPRVPYPIVNAALNVTSGSELATQERKAISWVFTPRFSGFSSSRYYKAREAAGKDGVIESYVSTRDFLGDTLNHEKGVRLGTAVAVSGAAANPNMGYHSSAQAAFLLTLFNVRLGWWVGNPTNANTYKRSGPRVALVWLFRELLGFVDEGSPYLNLSDGGHFENLGLYELVRRRCHFIIAIDGEADLDYHFGGLGGAVRKCRDDFGVEIDIDPRPIQPKDGRNGSHCVMGRIYYPQDEKGAEKTGWLLYIKASITGDEPADVEEYRRENPDFPQQSTADQFFSESQFESYRRLGLHVARTTLDHHDPQFKPSDPNTYIDKAFRRLAHQWELAPPRPTGATTHLAEAYSALMERLSASTSVTPLDDATIVRFPAAAHVPGPDRAAFFFRLDLLQLMENVFMDLNFANFHNWNHPSNAGWNTVFRYWAAKPEMQEVWKLQCDSYSKLFQIFFNDLIKDHNGPPERERN
ncbi:MAG TPA: patatin-like phospholipase family protein [Candidatus Saccharimonadales bacterium]|jgi:hypothetical protein|nr:patatin-like phospholipase family protein [Candidatus Saccharimonadales bacterium]